MRADPEVAASCQRLIEKANRDGPLPGIRALCFADGVPVWEGSVGDVAGQYRIGSITKTFTAAAVLQLGDEGRLALGDPLGRYVADAPFADRSILSLLAHSSGITAEPVGEWWERTDGRSWPDLCAANASAATVFAVSERHHYSNLGYALLGELVARLRARSWFDSISAFLLEPLGLEDTTYLPGPGAAQGLSRDPRTDTWMGEPATDSIAMAPAGQLWSTTRDLARWGDVLVHGGHGVLSEQTARRMRTVQAADPDTQHRGAYGAGVRLRWRTGSTLVGHTGSMPGFLAGLFCDARSGVGAVLLVNATTGLDPEALAADLVEVVEPSVRLVPASRDEVAADSPAVALAGDWYWGNSLLPLRPTSQGFVLGEGDSARSFRAVDQDVYVGLDGYFAGERMTVRRRSTGEVSHLEVVTFVMTREPYDARAPMPGGPPLELTADEAGVTTAGDRTPPDGCR